MNGNNSRTILKGNTCKTILRSYLRKIILCTEIGTCDHGRICEQVYGDIALGA